MILISSLAFTEGSAIPYQTGFEASEGFVAGQSIDGQDGWQVIEGGADAKISDALAQGGTQCVALEANSQIDKALSADTGQSIVWMEGYFQGEGTTADPSFPGDIPASAIVFFSATNGIQCLNGDGSGSGAWVNTTISSINKDAWYKISIRQDYTSKKWRCYINEAASPDLDLGFRNNEVTTLNGFRNFADTSSYLDTFRVIPAIKGDTNGDGKMDAADIVALINDPTGASFDIIQKDNADVDKNGSVEGADLTALINKILNRS